MVYIEQIIDLSTSIGRHGDNNKIELDFCLYNASGPRCGTVDTLTKLQYESKSGAIVTKSATLVEQNGNPHPRTYHTPDTICSFNSEGLPNRGIDYYVSSENRKVIYTNPNTTESSTRTSLKHKPYIVSLSGKTMEDNIGMIRRIAEANRSTINDASIPRISSIELNVACPNVIGKPIIGYDTDQLESILQRVATIYKEYDNTNLLPLLGIKLPPYFDFAIYDIVATIINKYKSIIYYVVSINTIGNTLCIDSIANMPYIASNNGYAGMSGSAIKYIALANVRKLRSLLHPSIQIIGVGGISTGQDVYNMLLCGATACQVATTYWLEGPTCFERIYKELATIMKEKGIMSIQDITNQLQPWSKEGVELSRQHAKQQQPSTTTSSSTKKAIGVSTSTAVLEREVNFYKIVSIVLSIVVAALMIAPIKGK